MRAYRAMLRLGRAKATEGKLENVQELIALAGSFHTTQSFSWSLATTLMTCIVLRRSAEGYVAIPRARVRLE